jgi:hypothetical protein
MHGPEQVLVHEPHITAAGRRQMLLPPGEITVERDPKE